MLRTILMLFATASVLLGGMPAHAKTRIVIFPFEAENAVPRWDWLGKGLAADVELRLLRISSVSEVLNRTPVPYRRTLQAAETMNVEYVIRGRYRVAGAFVEVSAEIVDLESPDMARTYKGRAPADSPLEALNELCASVPAITAARVMRTETGVLKSPTTGSAKAMEAYVAGLKDLEAYAENPVAEEGRLVPAIMAFKKSAGIDPEFYGAHYQLGRLHEMSGDIGLALAAYRKVEAITPGIRSVQKAIDRLTIQSHRAM